MERNIISNDPLLEKKEENKINVIRNYKTTINNEWKEWVNRQKSKNFPLEMIKTKLLRQNYCPKSLVYIID